MFQYLGSGRNRAVWRHGSFVVKIPLNEKGEHDNYHEARISKSDTVSGISYARCRLLGSILVMQYARYQGPASDSDGYIPAQNLPAWASYVDCQQVGYNKAGKIVAYDYGYY
jgi:hypothetical protein